MSEKDLYSTINNLEVNFVRIEDKLNLIYEQVKRINGKVAENTKWRVANEKDLERLINDREAKFKKYGDIIWKISNVGFLLYILFSKFL